MKNVESFYPLSPMQQGMLFHSLAEPDTGMYIELASVKLKGALNYELFKRSWQTVLDHHEILRTSFVWENVKEPVQVVHKNLQMPVKYLDWGMLSAEIREDKLRHYLLDEQMQGFDLSKAPMMKLTLIRTDDYEHIFIWTYHHILLDGWSVPLLLQEVIGLYTAFNQGLDLQLPPVRPFRDYILWLKHQDTNASEAYWRRTLAGFFAPTSLVVTKIDRLKISSEPVFDEIEINLPSNQTVALQNLAKRNQVTLNTIVQAAWAVLLSRYSGEKDVVFGVTVSGRPYDLPGTEQMIGLFINTLPVRVQIPPDIPLSTCFRELQANQAELRQYEYTPLAQVQGWSQVPRGTPLFDSILVFENFPIKGLDSSGQGSLDIQSGVFASHTNFPITLVATPDENLSLKISYNGQLFDRETIERMLDHLQVILNGMIVNPEQTIGQLPLLTNNEIHTILDEWSRTNSEPIEAQTVVQLFEEQVRRSPDSVAVVFAGKEDTASITYAALNRKANLLAHYLRLHGAMPEVLVGICVDRSIEMIVGVLGILKSGAGYVPLDPAYPTERRNFILQDSGAPILLTTEDFHKEFLIIQDKGQNPAKIICLDRDWDEIQRLGDPENPAPGAQENNLAYIIYTSGSTGRPKGVLICHLGLTNLVRQQIKGFGIDEGSRILQFASFGFDASVSEIFIGLIAGGVLVLVPQEILTSIPDLLVVMREQSVNTVTLPPSLLSILDPSVVNQTVPELKVLISAGEALPKNIGAKWAVDHKMFNAYGPTETTIGPTLYPIKVRMESSTSEPEIEGLPKGANTIPIGRPIPNTEIYLLDQDQRLVPVGVPGEIYIGGVGLARGYVNRPELTQEKFVDHIFYPGTGKKLYRTGDLARYLPGGDIEYLGRIDNQVKMRGFRIELGEIENVLTHYPTVQQAAVLMQEDAAGNKRLVAYLIPKNREIKLDLVELRQYIQKLLPDYMLPAHYIFLDELPLTTSGKVDRRRLMESGIGEKIHTVGEVSYEAPATADEIKLAQVWTQLLGVEKVGRKDNFFSLGGDSIMTIQLISRAKGAGIELTYRHIFNHPILHEMAREPNLNIRPYQTQNLISGSAPMTPIQQWFIEHHRANPERFNTSMLFAVNQPLDPEMLKRALEQIIAHHDVLRSSFSMKNENWVQEISEAAVQTPFYHYDLAEMSEVDRQDYIQSKAEELQSSFILDSPPLVRLAYFDSEKHTSGRLLVIFHHLVIDGVSIRIFVEDFLTVYMQLLGKSTVTLPAKTTSYLDWASRLVDYANSDAIYGEIEYWRVIEQLTSADNLYSLQLDFPDGLNTYGLVKDITLFLSTQETGALVREIPAKHALPVNAVLLTALLRSFYRQSGYRSILIETEGHGREEIPESTLSGIDLSRSIGWFTSLYPLYLELVDSHSNLEQVQSIANQIDKIPWRGMGFGLIKFLRKDPGLKDILNRIPQPEINFNYLGQFDQQGVALTDEPVSLSEAPIQVVNEDVGREQDAASPRSARLYIVAAITDGQLGIRWLYSQGIHQQSTILKMAQAYLDEVRTIIREIS